MQVLSSNPRLPDEVCILRKISDWVSSRGRYLVGKGGAALLLVAAATSLSCASDWQPLFDGLSFHGWTDGDGQAVKAPAWEVDDGMLHLDRSRGAGGNLLTTREFGDFELVFEWTVAAGANNGIKYRVQDFEGRLLGIEYQVIDDAAHPQLSSNHKTASLYDIYEARSHDVLRPAGEFNRGRIVVKDGRIQHWLNGHLITEAYVSSAEWAERIARSKFSDVAGFGTNPKGRIMITDHGDEVWYRNVFVRDLTHRPSSDDLVLSAGRRYPQRARCRGLWRRR